jgi:hypothetical protein
MVTEHLGGQKDMPAKLHQHHTPYTQTRHLGQKKKLSNGKIVKKIAKARLADRIHKWANFF